MQTAVSKLIQLCLWGIRWTIRNISDGGDYIRAFQARRFSPGENIFLIARIRVLREQLRGKIAWVGPHGMGVEFQTTELISFVGGL
jgi:Tfp pilus assembly protein PilZ